MKKLLYIISGLLTVNLLLLKCANPVSPNGGPRDTIPPTLLESTPTSGTTNFKAQEIELAFSELITAEKLKEELIITPKTDITYKSTTRKNQVILKFNGVFNDSTTYNLNFGNGIADITEKNPVVNLSIAFSTGNYIDSMKISGSVVDLYEQTPSKKYLVGLYPYSDTLNYFKTQPLYFTTANDSGNFIIQYIKSATYNILAFDDVNNNKLLDPDTEPHGFISKKIALDSSIVLEQPIRTLLQNIKPLALLSARPTGPYVEIKYNKTINTYKIDQSEWYHNLIGTSKDAIRLYKPSSLAYGDSIQLIIAASDSLNSSSTDTLQIVFLESNRKPASFSYNASSTKNSITNDHEIKAFFNKPIIAIDSSKFNLTIDSTFLYPLNPSFSWNTNYTELSINTKIARDSLVKSIEDLKVIDTLAREPKDKRPGSKTAQQYVDFNIVQGAFISIESDTSKQTSINIPIYESTSYGTIRFSIITDYESFTVQLLNTKKEVAYQNKNQKDFSFPRIKPGNYEIRILIDTNNDGKWSAGNLLSNDEPENIYLHPESTSVRENWSLDISLSF